VIQKRKNENGKIEINGARGDAESAKTLFE
jgi:hypothetical protein